MHTHMHMCVYILYIYIWSFQTSGFDSAFILFLRDLQNSLSLAMWCLREGLANYGRWAKSSFFFCNLQKNLQDKNGTYTSYQLEANQKKSNIWWLVKIMWNFNFSIHKVLLDDNCIHLFTCSLAALVLQQLSWVGATETMWPTEPNISTVCPFTKMFADPYLKRYKIWARQNQPESKHTTQCLTRYSPNPALFVR